MKRENQTLKSFSLFNYENAYLFSLILDPPLKKKSIPKIDLRFATVADGVKDKKSVESGEYFQLTVGKILSKMEI